MLSLRTRNAASPRELAGALEDGWPSRDPKPYDQVITKDAQTTPGIFKVHQIKSRYYYEIPASELGKDYLWVSQIARTADGAGYGGQMIGNHVVRWERHDNRILLRDVHYDIVADPADPVARAHCRPPIIPRSSWRSTSRRSGKTTPR